MKSWNPESHQAEEAKPNMTSITFSKESRYTHADWSLVLKNLTVNTKFNAIIINVVLYRFIFS